MHPARAGGLRPTNGGPLGPLGAFWPSWRAGGLRPPNGGPSSPLDKYKYIYSAKTNTNTYIAQMQIHIGCKYKYNNRGQIRYIVGVVGVVVGVRNISIRVRYENSFLI